MKLSAVSSNTLLI
jgi:hypothetical protein